MKTEVYTESMGTEMSGEVTKEIFTTVVFLRRDDEVLLAMKKRGFGVGRWNGAGGKIEPGETSEAGAKREVLEEIGVVALELTKVADMTFHELHDGTPGIVHSDIYLCSEWENEPTESEEMAPRWFPISELPLETMWPDDTFWLPRVLNGEKLRCTFEFDGNDTVLSHSIDTVEEFGDE